MSEDFRNCNYSSDMRRNQDLMIELVGIDGKHGRVAALENRTDKLEKIQLKLMLFTCASAVAGGGAVAGIIKLFS